MSLDLQLIRVLSVDDHALLREGAAALVNDEPDMKHGQSEPVFALAQMLGIEPMRGDMTQHETVN